MDVRVTPSEHRVTRVAPSDTHVSDGEWRWITVQAKPPDVEEGSDALQFPNKWDWYIYAGLYIDPLSQSFRCRQVWPIHGVVEFVSMSIHARYHGWVQHLAHSAIRWWLVG